MRCISPLTLRINKQTQTVPCGKCNFCLQNRRADWSFRLGQELKRSTSAFFLTLTYDDANLPLQDGLPTLNKKHCQLFMKRLRKKSSHKLTYYTVGEYGTNTQRPHYHSILFNLEPNIVRDLSSIWKHGHVMAGTVTPASIHYVTKYVINRMTDYPGREPPFSLISKKPAIGSNYLTPQMVKWHKDALRDYVQVNGKKGRIPRYLRDRIFRTVEKQLLALRLPDISVEEYWKEIERLSMLHEDPTTHYFERVQHQHEQITSKVNSLNKF